MRQPPVATVHSKQEDSNKDGTTGGDDEEQSSIRRRHISFDRALPLGDAEQNVHLSHNASPRASPNSGSQQSPLQATSTPLPLPWRKQRGEEKDTSGVATEASAVVSPVQPHNASARVLATGNSLRGDCVAAELDPANGAILIYPKKIDNLRRFRILFVGVLLFVSSSTQGMHSLFGTLYLQTVYRFSVREMAIVYLCGQAAGMFAFPFGALYDWFGPRVVVAAGSVVASLGHLLFALTFSGHIAPTVANCAVFYAIMCWGCYALDVTVLPAVLSHMPRDRGQPTGLLETFSGLGSSFFACLFRGFFANNYASLMWFLLAVTVVCGVVGTWYLEDAPYVVNRWQQRRITPREQLRKYLIRNRYMAQLVPRPRYMLLSVVLILMNFYLTIQAVVVVYLASEMTDGKRRGIAIGAIVIVLLVLILVVPLDAIDGPTEQDKQVIEAAKAKEEELRVLYAQDRLKENHTSNGSVQAGRAQGTGEERTSALCSGAPHAKDGGPPEVSVGAGEGNEAEVDRTGDPIGGNTDAFGAPKISDAFLGSNEAGKVLQQNTIHVRRLSNATAQAPSSLRHRSEGGGVLTQRMGLPPYKSAFPERPIISVDLDDAKGGEDDVEPQLRTLPVGSARRRTRDQPRVSLTLSALKLQKSISPGTGRRISAPPAAVAPPQQDAVGRTEAMASKCLNFHIYECGNILVENAALDQRSRVDADADAEEKKEGYHNPTDHFSHENPQVQVITLCGEVYVAPVYQTTFFESLTYLDMWLIAYTTLCVWGVGMTMVGNWNIYVMLLARYSKMEQKHYILFAAMAGVSTAGGRVFLGMYERILQIIRVRMGIVVVPTLLYPITSVGMLAGTILWIALPGEKVLVLAYLIGPSFYGMSSSLTPYVLGTIYDRDLGMHYGFCFFAGAIGFVLCYWCSWYLTYREETVLTPRGYLCVGERRCMNRAVGVYIALVFSSIISSFIVHRRYSRLVAGKLAQKRVIVPHLRRMFRCCGCGECDAVGTEGDGRDVNDRSGKEEHAKQSVSRPPKANPLSRETDAQV